jgi:hypothetical protein
MEIGVPLTEADLLKMTIVPVSLFSEKIRKGEITHETLPSSGIIPEELAQTEIPNDFELLGFTYSENEGKWLAVAKTRMSGDPQHAAFTFSLFRHKNKIAAFVGGEHLYGLWRSVVLFTLPGKWV